MRRRKMPWNWPAEGLLFQPPKKQTHTQTHTTVNTDICSFQTTRTFLERQFINFWNPYLMFWLSWRGTPSDPGWSYRCRCIADTGAVQDTSTSGCQCWSQTPWQTGAFKRNNMIVNMILANQNTSKEHQVILIIESCKWTFPFSTFSLTNVWTEKHCA